MTKKLEDQAEALERRLEQDAARLKDIQKRMSKQLRKRDRRFKLLLGAALLYRHAAGDVSVAELYQLAEEGLTRPGERAFVKSELERRLGPSPPREKWTPSDEARL